MSVRIQAQVPPSRGLTLPFYFAYDSDGLMHLGSQNGVPLWLGNQSSYSLSGSGWSYTVPTLTYAVTTLTEPGLPGSNYQCNYVSDFVLQDASGGRHALGLAYVWDNWKQCVYFPGAGLYSVTSGGDGVYSATLSISPSSSQLLAADPDGTTYSFGIAYNPTGNAAEYSYPSTVVDRNGNTVAISATGPQLQTVTITDTVGRQAVKVSSFASTGGDTVSVPGLSSYTVSWGTTSANMPAPNQVQEVSDPYCDVIGGWQAQFLSPTALSLPNGTEYQFQYDPTFGRLSKIIYPTGAWVAYTWGWSPLFESTIFPDSKGSRGCEFQYAVPVVVTRDVSFDGTHIALQQSFSYTENWNGNPSQWSTRQTTVTTTDMLRGTATKTVYNYGPGGSGGQPDDQASYAVEVPVELQIVYEDGGGNPDETVTKAWYTDYELACQLDTHDGSGLSGTFYLYGGGSQVTDKKEFDYGQIGSTSACSPSQLTAPGGTPLRDTQITYNTSLVTSSGFHIWDRPSSVVIPNFDGLGNTAETDYGYDSLGNATSKTVKCNPGCGSQPWTYKYDSYGQQTSMTDPLSNTTVYGYDPTYDTYLTSITYPNTGYAHIVNFGYNLWTGQLTSSQDQNGNQTNYTYSDPLGRLTSISYPDGGNTGYSYGSDCPQPATTTVLLAGASNYVETTSLDGLCHVTDTAITSDPQGVDYTDTTYDGAGRVWTVSNPYRIGDPTAGLTTYTYDPLGRATSVLYPDSGNDGTSYSGNSQTVTEPNGTTRTLTHDAAGRLTSVTEAAAFLTNYTYDALNNLRSVAEVSQTRNFAYNSLSQLTSATNPESGTTSYTYFANGPVASRTDARGITTTYGYDALNRVTSKTYSDGTPAAQYTYDVATLWGNPTTNALGRLVAAVTGGGLTSAIAYLNYDAMGRPTSYFQCTPVNCGSGGWMLYYTYDKAGDVTQWTHPAGFTIFQPVDGARHIMQLTSTLNDSLHPPNLAFGPGPNNSITYTAWGAIRTLTSGCTGSGCKQVQENYTYNNRLQPVEIQLGTSSNTSANYNLAYTYSGTSVPSGCPVSASGGNNGNVLGYTYTDGSNTWMSHSALYAYDGVNRLVCAQATGNMTYNLRQTQAPCLGFTFNGHNQINSSGMGFSYDAAGNELTDGTSTYRWDAEERLTQIDGGANARAYNAFDQYVDWAPGNSPQYLYDLWGHDIAYFDPGSGTFLDAFVPLGDREFVGYTGGPWGTGTTFNHVNNLGSVTQTTNSSGGVTGDYLFYPWGQPWSGVGMFAAFSDLSTLINAYAAHHRNYPYVQGRWLKPDPAGLDAVDVGDPQTWNMYAYAGNNPTTNTDPTGETYHVCQTDANGNQSNCTDISDEQFGQFQQENKDTLTFTGNGNVLQNGTVIGSYQQTSVDLSPFASDVIAGVNANHPGDFIAGVATQAVIAGVTGGAADAFLGGLFEGLGLAGEGTQTLGIAGAEGASSDYVDVTNPGSRLPNRATNVTAQEFGDNLQAQGFTKSVRGDVTVYTKGNTQYTVYPVSKSTGGPTAQVSINGTPVGKIRLQQ